MLNPTNKSYPKLKLSYEIVIVTRGRPQEMQTTANALIAASIPFSYARTKGDKVELDGAEKTYWFDAEHIGIKRQKVLKSMRIKDQFLMLDDDLQFQKVQYDYDKDKLSTKEIKLIPQLRSMFISIEDKLNRFGLVGIAPRFMIQTKPYPLDNRPQPFCPTFGINRKFLKGDEKFDRVCVGEDIDFVIQCVLNRIPHIMLTDYSHRDIKQGNRSGGCNIWRTRKLEQEMLQKVQSFHPEFVTAYTDKKGVPRVRVRWQKLAKSVAIS